MLPSSRNSVSAWWGKLANQFLPWPRAHSRLAKRRFEAASGRRFSGQPHFGPGNVEILGSLPALRSRSNFAAANNPWIKTGVDAWVSNLIGDGIHAAPAHPDTEIRKQIARFWKTFSARVDADGLLPFEGLQALAVRRMVIDGEAFALLINTPSGLLVRVIDADQIDASDTRELDGGRRVVAGIEFDAEGRRAACYVHYRRPTAIYAPAERIPAEDVIHLFNPLYPGQVRGLPGLASVLLRQNELDQLEDAQLMRQKIAAMFAGFLTDTNGVVSGSPFDGSQEGSILTSGLEPGTLKVLPPGFDIKFATPIEAQQSVEYIRLQLRAIAAGLGIPEHLLTGDLSQVNYSSIRASLVEFRRRLEALQYNVIIPQLCRPIYERAITLAVLSGELDAPDFENNASDYLAVEWYPPAQEWVDPETDAKAEALAVANGFKSRRQVVAQRGYDVEAIDAEIAADRQRETALNLNFSGGATNAP